MELTRAILSNAKLVKTLMWLQSLMEYALVTYLPHQFRFLLQPQAVLLYYALKGQTVLMEFVFRFQDGVNQINNASLLKYVWEINAWTNVQE